MTAHHTVAVTSKKKSLSAVERVSESESERFYQPTLQCLTENTHILICEGVGSECRQDYKGLRAGEWCDSACKCVSKTFPVSTPTVRPDRCPLHQCVCVNMCVFVCD